MNKDDNTPSVLREVDSLASIPGPLSPQDSIIPVMEVPKSFAMWQKLRIAIVLLGAILFLGGTGFLVHHLIISDRIASTIADALKLAAAGSPKKLQSAETKLATLVRRYPSDSDATAALAWLYAQRAILVGPEEMLSKKVRDAMPKARDSDNSISHALRVAEIFLDGDFRKALLETNRASSEFPHEPRLALVHAVTLYELGQHTEAVSTLEAAITKWPDYMPLVIAGMQTALTIGDKTAISRLVPKIEKKEGLSLYESLATIALSLPLWGDAPLASKTVSDLSTLIDGLAPLIADAPPKPHRIGQYLTGRVHLAAGKFDAAATALNHAVDKKTNDTILVWLALATKQTKGCAATLALLDAHPKVSSPGILDLRADCLLSRHQVNAAADVIETLRATNALPNQVRRLTWVLLVRQGKTSEAFESRPPVILGEDRWPALELYYQLKRAGRRKDIMTLARSFGQSEAACGAAMRRWHIKSPRRAFRKLNPNSNDPCVAALAARLLYGRLAPASLMNAVDQALQASKQNPMLEIDKARLQWLTEGRVKALARLDAIGERKPEALHLKIELARAYMEMAQWPQVLDVLADQTHPEALALRYKAHSAMKHRQVKDLSREADAANMDQPHPATAYVVAHRQLVSQKLEAAIETVTSALPQAGHWTSELAEIGAKAFNLNDGQAEADQLLKDAAKRVSVSAGLDEYWETQLALTDLNLRRGGKFTRRAAQALNSLRRNSVLDAKLSLNLSIVRTRMGDDDAAEDLIRDAFKRNPSLKPIYKQLKKTKAFDQTAIDTLEMIWPNWHP
ncbi:MAG: tetratricopeptide repeat protein [Myxococcota bacterium]|nr:tetratricopeptide repeat protein [Myxococcota bacterium]